MIKFILILLIVCYIKNLVLVLLKSNENTQDQCSSAELDYLSHQTIIPVDISNVKCFRSIESMIQNSHDENTILIFNQTLTISEVNLLYAENIVMKYRIRTDNTIVENPNIERKHFFGMFLTKNIINQDVNK
jgi:hypothetical protein